LRFWLAVPEGPWVKPQTGNRDSFCWSPTICRLETGANSSPAGLNSKLGLRNNNTLKNHADDKLRIRVKGNQIRPGAE